MTEKKASRKIKELERGNRSYRDALYSSSLLLAQALGPSGLGHYNPQVLCLAFEDKVSRMAHVLFNHDRNSFSSFTVNREESRDVVITQVETVIGHYPIEVLLILGEKGKDNGLAEFVSDLLGRSTLLASKVGSDEIQVILGACDLLAGDVNLSSYSEQVARVTEAEEVEADSV